MFLTPSKNLIEMPVTSERNGKSEKASLARLPVLAASLHFGKILQLGEPWRSAKGKGEVEAEEVNGVVFFQKCLTYNQ